MKIVGTEQSSLRSPKDTLYTHDSAANPLEIDHIDQFYQENDDDADQEIALMVGDQSQSNDDYEKVENSIRSE